MISNTSVYCCILNVWPSSLAPAIFDIQLNDKSKLLQVRLILGFGTLLCMLHIRDLHNLLIDIQSTFIMLKHSQYFAITLEYTQKLSFLNCMTHF